MSFTLIDTAKINYPTNVPPITPVDVPAELIGVNEFQDGYAIRNTAGRTFLLVARQDDSDIQIIDPAIVSAMRESFYLSPTIIVDDVTVARPISAAYGAATRSISAQGVYTLAGLEKLANLEYLDFSDSNITSLDPLTGLQNLHTVNLRNNENLSDLSPLLTLPSLAILNVEGINYTVDNIKVLNTLFNNGVAVIASVQFKGIVTNRTTITLSNAQTMVVELRQHPISNAITARVYPPIIETPVSYVILRSNGNILYTISAIDGQTNYAIPAGQTSYILNNASSIKFLTEETPLGSVMGNFEQLDNGTTVLNPARDEIAAPDANFYAAVQRALFKESDVYIDEIENLSRLNVSASNIGSLAGIEAFTSLLNLDVSFNPLATPSQIELITLTTLNAAHSVDDYDPSGLSGIPDLTFINIEGCTTLFTPEEDQTLFQDLDREDSSVHTLDPAELIPAVVGDTFEVAIYTNYTAGEFHTYIKKITDVELTDLRFYAGEDCDNAGDLLIDLEFINEEVLEIGYSATGGVVTGAYTSHGYSSGDAVFIDFASPPLQGYHTITVTGADAFTLDNVTSADFTSINHDTVRVNKLSLEQLQSLAIPSFYIQSTGKGRINIVNDNLPTHLWAFGNESLLAEFEAVASSSEATGTMQTNLVYSPFMNHYYMDVTITHNVQDATEAGILNNDNITLYGTGIGDGEVTGSIPDPDNIGDFIDLYTYTIAFKLKPGDLYMLSEQGRLPVFFQIYSISNPTGDIQTERQAAYDVIEEAQPVTVRVHTNYFLEGFKLEDLDIEINPGDEPALVGPFSNKFNFAGTANNVPVTNLLHVSFKSLTQPTTGLIKIKALTLDPTGVL